MNIFKLLSAFFIASFLMLNTSCKSEDTEGSDRNREERISGMISGAGNAFAIFSINVNNLVEKSGLNDGILPIQFQFLMDQFLQYINNDEMTGLDLNHTIHIFMDTDGADEPEYFVVNLVLKDEASFQSFVEKELDFKMISDEKSKFAVAQSRDKQMLATWDEGRAMLINANSTSAAKNGEKYIEKLYDNQRKSEIDEKVIGYLNNSADISFYSIGNRALDFVKVEIGDTDPEISQMATKMEQYAEGTSTAAYINFENGKIVVKNELVWNEKFLNDFPYLSESAVSEDILKYLSDNGKAISASTLSLNMDAIWNLFDFIVPQEQAALLDKEMKTLGIAMNMLKSAISGEIAFALTGFDFGSDKIDINTQNGDEVYFSLVFSTNNPAILNEIFKASEEVDGGDGYFTAKKMHYIVTDKYLVVTSNAALAKNINSNTLSNLDMDGLENELLKSQINGVLDFDALSKAISILDQDEVSNALKLFDKVTFEADLNSSVFTLHLKEKNQNSLRVLTGIAVESIESFM